MFYVYILKSRKSERLYTGSTNNLRRRFNEHNSKKGGYYTSRNAPFDLIYYEAYLCKKDATAAEIFFKTGYGKEILHGKLKNYYNDGV